MLNYIFRRVLLMLPTLLGITLVVFFTMALSPGGISSQSLVDGFGMNPQEKKALEDYYNRRYGLDQPAPIQYLRWLNNVSPIGFETDDSGALGSFSLTKGSDLGESFRYGRPVWDLLKERVPITLLLNVLSLPLIYFIAITVGVRAATDRGGRFDVSSSVVMLGLWSVPTMLTGVLLIGFFASDQYWHWFPTSGLSSREAMDMPFMPHWSQSLDVLKVLLTSILATAVGIALALGRLSPVLVGLVALIAGAVGIAVGMSWGEGDFVRGFLLDRGWHLVLPILCLSYGSFAFLSRLTRSAVLENLQADYARTARAKGVPEPEVLWSHVFRNSLLPLITVFAALLPGLLAGSVIVESIFSIDGMGKLAIDAVKGRDRELVLSITLISGILTLVGYLLADLMYAIADPRVSYE